MLDDLVARLRQPTLNEFAARPLMNEAADEIERLRERLAEQEKANV